MADNDDLDAMEEEEAEEEFIQACGDEYDQFYDEDELLRKEFQVSKEKDPEEFAYSCYTLDEYFRTLKPVLEQTASELQVSEDAACLVLQVCSWNRDTVRQRFHDNATCVLVEAHAIADPKDSSACPSEMPSNECGICAAPLDDASALQPLCGHSFCTECWMAHFSARLETVPTLQMECLACSVFVGESFVIGILAQSPKQLALYRKLTLNAHMRSNPMLVACPGVDCGLVASAEETAPKPVTCKCETQFCFACGDDYHVPLTCKSKKDWMQRCAADSQSASYIVANTKRCPKCDVCIEKSGGCNHMVCAQCSYDFCWICSEPWRLHGTQYYHCSRYKPDKQKEMQRNSQMEMVKRYLFFFERYSAHQQSIALEQRAWTKLQKSIKTNSEDKGDGTWIDYQYLTEAFEVLAKGRRTLQYTYPHAYYLSQDAPERQLMEYQQAQLEHQIETLSFKIERAELADKAAIRSHCRQVQEWRKSLVAEFFKHLSGA